MIRYLLPLIFVPFLFISDAEAQRNVNYESLLQRSDQPSIYVDHLALPGTDGNGLLAVNFRMDYDLLPFRRVRDDQSKPGEETEFFATARMNLEIFRGSTNNRGRNFDPVTRNSWADTAWVETYEMTRSRSNHLEGAMSAELEPGQYGFFLDLNRDGSQRGARSRERSFEIPDFQSTDKGVITLLSQSTENEDAFRIKFLNYGENVLYGQDYQLMTVLPSESEHQEYRIKVERLLAGSEDQTEGTPLFETSFNRNDVIYTNGFSHAPESKRPEFLFDKSDDGFPVFITTIPNRQFPNTRFKLTVTVDGEDEPITSKIISSRWIGMPVSLLNLDVAIDMLRFIVDDSEIRQLKRGSAADRERKFREFWAERDPTQETEFNELMAEYYNRIDHAYNNYTTPERPGYDSDQGRAYILFGDPIRKERTYPTDGPTREIWVYNNRTLVFEATTGFGDFRLVQER
jgi:GWxTD domain-containing protein